MRKTTTKYLYKRFLLHAYLMLKKGDPSFKTFISPDVSYTALINDIRVKRVSIVVHSIKFFAENLGIELVCGKVQSDRKVMQFDLTGKAEHSIEFYNSMLYSLDKKYGKLKMAKDKRERYSLKKVITNILKEKGPSRVIDIVKSIKAKYKTAHYNNLYNAVYISIRRNREFKSIDVKGFKYHMLS